MFMSVRQNSTKKFFIWMLNNDFAAFEGLTPSTITVTLAKPGAAAAVVSITMVERQPGIYEVTPLAAHRNTLGEQVWIFKPNASNWRLMRQESVTLTDIDELVNVPRSATPLNAGSFRMQVGGGQAANINILPAT